MSTRFRFNRFLERTNVGPKLAFSEELHAQKYRAEGESFREAMSRVAGALSDGDEHYHAFREILLDMRFMPGGRVQNAMGSPRGTTPYNCFVSGTIEDSALEGEGSIHKRNGEALATMRLGGGIGYDFSTLRPKGDLIKTLGSQSTGPIDWMDLFNAIGNVTASAGNRRGAQMGVLRVDHPDIEAFIHCKQNQHKLNRFNISVAITDAFMEAVQADKPHTLRFGGRDYRQVDARALWDMLMRSTWDWAEPGVLFIDQINRMNNLWYCEEIAATNPCGEQPLPPHGACLLGSVNLVRYLLKEGARWTFDADRLGEDIPHIVRAMDNVVDRAVYPLPAQELEARSKRRMGLGVSGLANCVEAMGFGYGTPEFVKTQKQLQALLTNECYKASARLAAEKGSFELFEPELYLRSEFVKGLWEETRELIKRHGIRNSHLTSIAPTGTISLCADNISSGIEPVFNHFFTRQIIMNEGARVELVEDYGYRELGVTGRTADLPNSDAVHARFSDDHKARHAYMDKVRDGLVRVDEHLAVLCTAQRYTDSAVSKTVNVPSDVGWDDFKNVYVMAWTLGAKGCTTYRTDGLRAGIFNAKPVTEGQSCRIDKETGRRECD